MDTLDCILSRKSVRKYTDQVVSEQDVLTLLKAAMAAPTGKNVRPWEFIVVRDRAILDAMAEELPYAKMLSIASVAIVVCGDASKSDYWYVDCSAATQNLLLAAENMGLGAVWTATYPYEDRMDVCKRYLNLPSNILSLCVIPVGYPTKPFVAMDKFDTAKIHNEKY
ncbi:MAG: nitroreductase family protein [Bacteroidales bacterium]|nr:nitroreductase family protein [Bacteroidales bacterium]